MEYLILKFGLGVGLLLIATHVFVKLAIRISRAWRISPLIIGTTLVAVGTSLPELVVSTTALLRGDVGLAWGNIVGSNIVNVLLVLPVGILIGKLRVGTTKTQRNVGLMLAATAMFVAVQMGWLPGVVSGLVLLGMAVWVSVEEYIWGLEGRKHEDAVKLKQQKQVSLGIKEGWGLLVMAAGIIGGGVMTVRAVEEISVATGWSTSLLGLSLTAVVTSLPELLTTVFAQKEHQGKVTLGDIVGSNIYNLLLIGGVLTLFSGTKALLLKEMIWLGLTAGVFGGVLRVYSGRAVPRWVAGMLLALLGVYLVILGK